MTGQAARHDPTKEFADYDDLLVARELIERRQDDEYWKRHPMPPSPLGRVRFEEIRQIATFLLPLACIAVSVHVWGWATLWITIPIGLLIGKKMDSHLERDLQEAWSRETSLDRGRYRAVQILSAHLGIPRNEITLQMIWKMALDCRKLEELVEKHYLNTVFKSEKLNAFAKKRREELADAARKQRLKHAHDASTNRSRSHQTETTAAGMVAASTATGITFLTNTSDTDSYSYERYEDAYYPAINPSSGLPMMPGGGMVDVAGNAFGTNFDH